MDDPFYIELRTSKDHWTLIRRILKSFKWYIYMSNNSGVKRDGIKRKWMGSSHGNATLIFDFILDIWGNCHPKGGKIIVFTISSQQQKTLPGIRFKVRDRAAADLLQCRFNAAVISNPAQVRKQNNCSKYVTSWAESVSTFPQILNHQI